MPDYLNFTEKEWWCHYENKTGCYYISDPDLAIVCAAVEKMLSDDNLSWEKTVFNSETVGYWPSDDDGYIFIYHEYVKKKI